MYNGLIHLGFSSKDFLLMDNSDGKGVFIGEWNSDKPQPSVEEIKTAQDAYEAEYNSNQYKRDRALDYASLQDQADMQYWDAVNGTTKWQEHIAEIKAKHPKE